MPRVPKFTGRDWRRMIAAAHQFVRRRTKTTLAAAAFAAMAGVGGGYYAWTLHRALPFGEHTWVIARGATLTQIADQLQARKLIGETVSLRLYARAHDLGRRIRSGEYRFPDGTTLAQFLHSIAAGRGQVGLKVTILEGWTFAQMRAKLREAPKLRPTTADLSGPQLMAELGLADTPPEGQFFPDTYHYTAGDSDMSVYRQAYELMQQRLAAAWENRAPGIPLKNKNEVLIMASIIEKESYMDAEQRKIAGVFHNRLRKKMRLQADPTVIYGLGEKFQGNLTRAHLKTDTPYNTYTRGGLPPAPISLPGDNALRAAARPQNTNAYYFVAKGRGEHHFSATLAAHNRAVNCYIRRRGCE